MPPRNRRHSRWRFQTSQRHPGASCLLAPHFHGISLETAVIRLLLLPLAPPRPRHHTFNTSIMRTLLLQISLAMPLDLSLASWRLHRLFILRVAGFTARFSPSRLTPRPEVFSRRPLFKIFTIFFPGIFREARRAVAERLLLADVLRAWGHPRLLRGLLQRNYQDAHPHQDG